MVLIPTHGPPVHPGEMLREEFVKPLGMTQMALAGALHLSFQSVNAILNERRSITPDTALRLEQLFGASAQFWLNLQMAWDLYHEIHGPNADVRKDIKRHPAISATQGAR